MEGKQEDGINNIYFEHISLLISLIYFLLFKFIINERSMTESANHVIFDLTVL